MFYGKKHRFEAISPPAVFLSRHVSFNSFLQIQHMKMKRNEKKNNFCLFKSNIALLYKEVLCICCIKCLRLNKLNVYELTCSVF